MVGGCVLGVRLVDGNLDFLDTVEGLEGGAKIRMYEERGGKIQ